MTEKSIALRLADCLDDVTYTTRSQAIQAAEELRRLHSLNQELLEALRDLLDIVPPLWECAERAKDLVDKIEGAIND